MDCHLDFQLFYFHLCWNRSHIAEQILTFLVCHNILFLHIKLVVDKNIDSLFNILYLLCNVGIYFCTFVPCHVLCHVKFNRMDKPVSFFTYLTKGQALLSGKIKWLYWGRSWRRCWVLAKCYTGFYSTVWHPQLHLIPNGADCKK